MDQVMIKVRCKIRDIPWEETHNKSWGNINYEVILHVHGQLNTVRQVCNQILDQVSDQLKEKYEHE